MPGPCRAALSLQHCASSPPQNRSVHAPAGAAPMAPASKCAVVVLNSVHVPSSFSSVQCLRGVAKRTAADIIGGMRARQLYSRAAGPARAGPHVGWPGCCNPGPGHTAASARVCWARADMHRGQARTRPNVHGVRTLVDDGGRGTSMHAWHRRRAPARVACTQGKLTGSRHMFRGIGSKGRRRHPCSTPLKLAR